jgi:hypothetical protein
MKHRTSITCNPPPFWSCYLLQENTHLDRSSSNFPVQSFDKSKQHLETKANATCRCLCRGTPEALPKVETRRQSLCSAAIRCAHPHHAISHNRAMSHPQRFVSGTFDSPSGSFFLTLVPATLRRADTGRATICGGPTATHSVVPTATTGN